MGFNLAFKGLRDANFPQNTVGRRQAHPDNVHRPHIQQPSTYENTEAANAVLGSWWWAVCRPKHVELHTNRE